MNASTPITLNTFESREARFTSALTGFSFGRASPVLHSRIQALIGDIIVQEQTSIQALQALKEECRHG